MSSSALCRGPARAAGAAAPGRRPFTAPRASRLVAAAQQQHQQQQQQQQLHHHQQQQQQQQPGAAIAAVLAAAVLVSSQPQSALAAEQAALPPTVYFGNGCFWGRQKDFVDTERSLGRSSPEQISALVGYAGGQAAGPGGKVCYYYATDPRTVYERLGHAEVVQVALSDEQQAAEQEFKRFADTYFADFRALPRGRGMMRLDPQDAGPGYRNVVGLPGGINSPYFKLLAAANVNGMELREGRGNVYQGGRASEGDELNVVWVVDSDQLPFYRAENWHQFHSGIGKAFPASYTRDLKAAVAETGRIEPTGCIELPF